MKTANKPIYCLLLVISLFFNYGCAKQPLHRNSSNIDELTVDELRTQALKCKESILIKQKILTVCLRVESPPTQKCLDKFYSCLSERGEEPDEWMDSYVDDMIQFEAFRQKLIEKGEDTSDLDIKLRDENKRIYDIIIITGKAKA